MEKKKTNKEVVKTSTFKATVAVSKSKTGMDYVQIMPENPSVGLVMPFHGLGFGQMLTNGTFDFIRRIRKRRKPELKLPHSSVSYGNDGYDRYVFKLPSEQRREFHKLLAEESAQAGLYVALDN